MGRPIISFCLIGFALQPATQSVIPKQKEVRQEMENCG